MLYLRALHMYMVRWSTHGFRNFLIHCSSVYSRIQFFGGLVIQCIVLPICFISGIEFAKLLRELKEVIPKDFLSQSQKQRQELFIHELQFIYLMFILFHPALAILSQKARLRHLDGVSSLRFLRTLMKSSVEEMWVYCVNKRNIKLKSL